VNHFETGLATSSLTKAADMDSWLKLSLLLPRKMEKAQRKLTTAVANSYQQVATPTVNRFSEQNLAAYEAAFARIKSADFDKLCAIFVSQGQQEQKIVDTMQT
jgi:hypothetical protein